MIHFHCYMSLDWADKTEFIGTRNDPALTPIAELTDKEKNAVTIWRTLFMVLDLF